MKNLDTNKLQKPVICGQVMLPGPDLYLTISDFAIHEAGSVLRWATSQGYSMATPPTALARPYLHFQISQEKKDFANLMAETQAFRAEFVLNGPHPEIITGSVH